MNLKKIAEQFYTAIGSKENLRAIEHCATRLRFVVNNEDLVNSDALKQLEEVKGYIYQTGQHQVIFGTGTVNKVYAEITGTNSNVIDKDEIYQNLSPLQKISRIFGDIFIPIIPVLVVTGLFMGLRGLIVSLGVELSPEAQTLSVILTDTAFIFLPVFITWSASKKFGGTEALGILTGLILISPALPNAWAVASGTATPLMVGIFGFDFALVGYQGAIITPLLISWLACIVEKKSRQIIPDILALLLVPLTVISFVILFGLILLGPALHSMEYGLGAMFKSFVTLPFGLGGLIIGFFQQLLTATGLHHMLIAVEVSMMDTLGYNPLNAIITASMGGMLGAGFAVAFTKKGKERSDTLSLLAPVFFGITEPLLFGITLINPKVFLAGMIAGGMGGFVAGLVQLQANGLGLTYIPGTTLYIGTDYMLWYIAVMAISITLGIIFGKIALASNKDKS